MCASVLLYFTFNNHVTLLLCPIESTSVSSSFKAVCQLLLWLFLYHFVLSNIIYGWLFSTPSRMQIFSSLFLISNMRMQNLVMVGVRLGSEPGSFHRKVLFAYLCIRTLRLPLQGSVSLYCWSKTNYCMLENCTDCIVDQETEP